MTSEEQPAWTDRGQTKCCRELHFYRYVASDLGWEVREYARRVLLKPGTGCA